MPFFRSVTAGKQKAARKSRSSFYLEWIEFVYKFIKSAL